LFIAFYTLLRPVSSSSLPLNPHTLLKLFSETWVTINT